MRSWLDAVRLSAMLVAVAVVGLTTTAEGQSRPTRDSVIQFAEIDKILRDGTKLEQQLRWGEALAHYEDAVRRHPSRPELTDRLSVARLHYEVGRRYSDHTFVSAIQAMSERDALELYNDVLLKVHAHYVEQPDWAVFLRRGSTSMEIALSEPAFLKQHGVRPSDSTVQAHFGELNHALTTRPVRTRQESREAMSFIAHSTADRFRVPPQAIIMEYACAVGASLDDYSSFLTGSQLDEIMSQIEGNFVGLGIELKTDSNSLLIVNVIGGGPAERAGIRAGDRIIEVDGSTMRDVSTDAAADMLKGAEGTWVNLVVVNAEGMQNSVRVLRQVVEVPSVESVSIIDASYGIGYLKLASFQKTTSRDVEAALWQLHRDGMRTLIIDVRGNPGGLLTAAVEVADKFITEGTIVSTRGRGTGEDFDYKAHLVGTWRVPLTVVIDGDSASASEIFAAAIRDSQRGTIVGQRSFGKGSVQGIFPLSVGHAGLRLTTAKFFSPNGAAISGKGVMPHVMVTQADQQVVAKPLIDEDDVRVPAVSDAALAAAVQVARRQVAQR